MESLSDDDVQRIADAVVAKLNAGQKTEYHFHAPRWDQVPPLPRLPAWEL